MINNIRKRRKELGLTQYQLCVEAGLSDAAAVSRFELNKADPTLATAFKLATALKTTVDELFQPGGDA